MTGESLESLELQGRRPRRVRPRGRPSLPHGEVRTPAFVPLASNATRRGAARGRGRGARLRDGARQHLPPLHPAGRTSASRRSAACTSSWAGGGRSSPTRAASRCSRMGHGSVADEIKRSRERPRQPRRRDRGGGRHASAPTSTAASGSWAPRPRWRCRRALGSDVALAFDECTPFHVERDYTARSMERTHRWLDRCVAWQREHAPAGQLALRDRPGRRVRGPARRVERVAIAAAGVDGIAIGGSLGQEKEQMREVVELVAAAGCPTTRRATCSGSATWTTSCAPSAPGSTRSTAPPRRGSPATARRSCPTRSALAARPGQVAARADSREPIAEGCPCPACREHTRGYLHYLVRGRRADRPRLLTLHNLTFMAELMRGARAAIEAGEYDAYARARAPAATRRTEAARQHSAWHACRTLLARSRLTNWRRSWSCWSTVSRVIGEMPPPPESAGARPRRRRRREHARGRRASGRAAALLFAPRASGLGVRLARRGGAAARCVRGACVGGASGRAAAGSRR